MHYGGERVSLPAIGFDEFALTFPGVSYVFSCKI